MAQETATTAESVSGTGAGLGSGSAFARPPKAMGAERSRVLFGWSRPSQSRDGVPNTWD